MRRTTADSGREEVKTQVDKVRKCLSESVRLLSPGPICAWKMTVRIMCSCRRCANRWTPSSRSFLFVSNNRNKSLLSLPPMSPLPLGPYKPVTRKDCHHRKERAVLSQLNRWTEKSGELIRTYWDWGEVTCTRGLLLNTKKENLQTVCVLPKDMVICGSD